MLGDGTADRRTIGEPADRRKPIVRTCAIVLPQGFLADLRAVAHETHAMVALITGGRDLDEIEAHGLFPVRYGLVIRRRFLNRFQVRSKHTANLATVRLARQVGFQRFSAIGGVSVVSAPVVK
jgi:hypothetical protein